VLDDQTMAFTGDGGAMSSVLATILRAIATIPHRVAMDLDALLPFWNGGHAKTLDFRQVKTEVIIEERSQRSSVGELHGLPLTVSPHRHVAVTKTAEGVSGSSETTDHNAPFLTTL
jgi:hypothetical protein